MKVATILPKKHLHLTKDDDYFMCLAPAVAADAEYAKFFQDRAAEGKYVIMDNGVIEGEPKPIEELIELALSINATELVLPDIFREKDATLRAVFSALDKVAISPYKGKVMAVAQGSNYEENRECLEMFMNWPINAVGLPKVMTHDNKDTQARIRIANWFLKQMDEFHEVMNRMPAWGMELHLLGCWGAPLEIGMAKSRTGDRIRGVDSGIAFMYTKRNMLISDGPKEYVHIDFSNDEVNEELLKENIKEWKESCTNVSRREGLFTVLK